MKKLSFLVVSLFLASSVSAIEHNTCQLEIVITGREMTTVEEFHFAKALESRGYELVFEDSVIPGKMTLSLNVGAASRAVRYDLMGSGNAYMTARCSVAGLLEAHSAQYSESLSAVTTRASEMDSICTAALLQLADRLPKCKLPQ